MCVGCAVDLSGSPGGVVGRDGGFFGVSGWQAVGVASGVVLSMGSWGRVAVGRACYWWWCLDCLVAAMMGGGRDGGPRVFGGEWACLVLLAGWRGLGLLLRVSLSVVPWVCGSRWLGTRPSGRHGGVAGRRCVPVRCSHVHRDGGCSR